MVKFIVKRLLWVIPVLLGASFLIFSLLHASPGDPAITSLGITATQEELDQFNEMHNLNDPLLVQYGKYIYNLAVKGDFGRSYRTNDLGSAKDSGRMARHHENGRLCICNYDTYWCSPWYTICHQAVFNTG